MARELISFSKILLLMGGAMLLLVVAHLGIRGFQMLPESPAWELPDGDPQRGKAAIQRHGCGACHVVPGVRDAQGRVGPKLEGFRDQVYIAGVLPNTPENLMIWIQHPRSINPLTAMPDLEVSEQEARDIAAYLYAMR